MARDDLSPPAHRTLELDGLRGAAIVVVLFAHLHVAAFKGGFFGVDLFFALSGVLVGGMLFDRSGVRPAMGLTRLAVRRILRVVPLHLTMLAVVGLALLTLPVPDGDEAESTGRGLLPSATYLLGYLRLDQERAYSTIDHTWSLAVEVHLYILVPLVLMLIPAVRRRRHVFVLALSVAIAVMLWRVHVFHQRPFLPSIYAQTDTRADAFLIGVAGAAALPRLVAFARGRFGWQSAVLLGLSQLLFVGLVLNVSIHTYGVLSYGLTASAIVFTITVLLAGWLAPEDCLPRRILRHRVLVHLGVISFSLYLWHLPLEWFTQELPLSHRPLVVVQALLSLAAAEASYRWLETPMHSWARRTAARVGRAPQARVAAR